MTWPPKQGRPSAERARIKAMLRAKGIATPRAKPVQHEAKIQAEVVAFLDRALPDPKQVFWSATLNGVKVDDITRKRLREQGLRPGVLDLVFIPLVGLRPGVTLWCELKSKDGVLSAEQKTLFNVLGPLGLMRVCRSLDQVYAALVEWDLPLRAHL